MGFIGWKRHGVYKQENLWGLYGSSKNVAKMNNKEKNLEKQHINKRNNTK